MTARLPFPFVVAQPSHSLVPSDATSLPGLSGRLQSWPWAIALGLLLGGAAGNLADRLFRSPGPLRGFVIDWIKLPYFPPTFNIADSAITIGAALLVLASVRGWRLDGDSPRSDQEIQQTAQGTDVPPPVNP